MADLWGENDEEDVDDMLPDGEEDDILDMETNIQGQQNHALLMRFCPHDSSMLYPQVCIIIYYLIMMIYKIL